MERNSDFKNHELIDELDEDLDDIDIHDEYPTRRKKTSRSIFQEQPLVWGAIGIVFLLSLISLVFGNGNGSIDENLGMINNRLEKLERGLASLEDVSTEQTVMAPQIEDIRKSLSELDGVLKSLKTHTDNMGQKVARIEKKLETPKSTIKSQSTKGSQSGSAVNIAEYTVAPGDTLYRISQKYGTTVDEIRRLNNLGKDQDIFPGQKLKVPK